MNFAQADLNITTDVIPLRLTGKAFHICVALHWTVLLFVFSKAFGTLRSINRSFKFGMTGYEKENLQ